MNKSIHFTGQPTFVQLLHLLPLSIISQSAVACQSDRYYKTFSTYGHLVTMLFACFGHCASLREVVTGMRALEGRLRSAGIRNLPARSTFSEANRNRNSKVFERIYFAAKAYFDRFYPDSRGKKREAFVIDSTVISLFQEIFKGTGTAYSDGRRKGGLKVHMAVPVHEQHPSIVRISDGSANDTTFSKGLEFPPNSTVIMDRGYRDYQQYNRWTKEKVRWITRPRENLYYELIEERAVSKQQKERGIEKDLHIKIGYPQPKTPPVFARLIHYTDKKTNKKLQFITNDLSCSPVTVAQLYQKRWSIEVLFKRLKQNMPLHYFLGDNRNAIEIQIWCALIADLLLQVVRRHVKRNWAFSNIVGLVRLHLFNYLNLFSFLENPERCTIQCANPTNSQLRLKLFG